MNPTMRGIGIGRTGTQTPNSTAFSLCFALIIDHPAFAWLIINGPLCPLLGQIDYDGRGIDVCIDVYSNMKFTHLSEPYPGSSGCGDLTHQLLFDLLRGMWNRKVFTVRSP
jgi:hypothetical protein